MNVINILKALSNEKRLQIVRWLKEPDKHFSSSHCDVSKDGVCVGLIEKNQAYLNPQYLNIYHNYSKLV